VPRLANSFAVPSAVMPVAYDSCRGTARVWRPGGPSRRAATVAFRAARDVPVVIRPADQGLRGRRGQHQGRRGRSLVVDELRVKSVCSVTVFADVSDLTMVESKPGGQMPGPQRGVAAGQGNRLGAAGGRWRSRS